MISKLYLMGLAIETSPQPVGSCMHQSSLGVKNALHDKLLRREAGWDTHWDFLVPPPEIQLMLVQEGFGIAGVVDIVGNCVSAIADSAEPIATILPAVTPSCASHFAKVFHCKCQSMSYAALICPCWTILLQDPQCSHVGTGVVHRPASKLIGIIFPAHYLGPCCAKEFCDAFAVLAHVRTIPYVPQQSNCRQAVPLSHCELQALL
jgi:hypothetical protein